MSQAFVRERDGEAVFEDLPERTISPHPNFVTPEGLARIEAEVARLQAAFSALTPEAQADVARVTRDLAYWTARRSSAQLVEAEPGDVIRFGSTVTILAEDDSRRTYRIVGEDEADPAQGTISYVSPMARALTGKVVGDVVEVNGHESEIAEVA